MITHELVQGTAEWHAYRAAHDNASDAPAMMGVSGYKTRDQLIAERATGIVPEVDAATQRLFDSGHRFEALARPLAEAIIEQDLYPCTGSLEDSRLSASFDGLTMLEDMAFEHKRLNKRLRAALSVPGCTGADLPMEYQIQMEQQCAVSGCERVLFLTSDWDDNDQLIEEMHCWYTPNLELRAQIVAGWEQFHKDVAAYVAPEAKPAAVVAEPMESLPAVSVRLDGKLAVVSNLPDFATALRAFIERIPAKPDTDQDFANAESACKALKRAEDALTAGEDAALGEMVDFEAMRRQVRDLKELARVTRLATEKLVTARKEQIRGEIVAGGITALREHITGLNAAMPAPYMPQVPADFAGAIKGKRTVDSLRGAVNDELARAKIAANEIATRIHANVKTLEASGLVVHDAAVLVLKASDDLAAIIANRKAAEQQRQEAERERIRAEEAERTDREAREKLAAEERAAQAAIAQAAKAETVHPAVAQDLGGLVREQHTEAVAGLDAQQVIGTAQRAAAAGPAVVPLRTAAPAPAERTGTPTLKLGTINERFGGVLTISADGLRTLGFEIVARERGACLYHEADFPLMLAALVRHIDGVQEKAAA